MNIVTRTYESLLPFLVVEAISSQNLSFNSMSVRMMDKGWAWLVSGRKLLVWRFKENKSHESVKARRMLSPCFELQLPQSDIVHRADLIHVFFMPRDLNVSLRAVTVPSALVVSPEGVIRIWSNIANERFTESTIAEVQGQEFCTLSSLSSYEYLLGTTTGSIYLLTIDINAHDPKRVISCSALNEPPGILSGFARRMTNVLFGPNNAEISGDSRRPLITVPKFSQSTIELSGSKDRPFFVLTSTIKLRQWARTDEGLNSTNVLVREWDLQKSIHSELISSLRLSENDRISFWPVDMTTTTSKEILILFVTLDTSRDNAINYATCVFNPFQAGAAITSMTVLRSHSWHYSNETEDQLLALRFLERRQCSSPCFVYDRKFLFLVQPNQDILDAIDYGNQDDSILGAGMIDNHPILFTQRDGLIYVVPVASNKSKFNETSIQIEPVMPGSSRGEGSESMHRSLRDSLHHKSSVQTEHMLLEVDENEENIDQSNFLDQSRRTDVDKNQSVNKSLNESSLNKSADKSTSRRLDDLSEILRDKEFEWVQQIDNKQFSLASETLEKLANDSETLKDRKETLIALSRLAKLAA